jgi:small redox-active disulfide protein 2
MSQDDHSRIRVGEHEVGVIGLKATIEEITRSHADKTDDDVQRALLDRLAKTNYIPGSARDDYGKAFVREFRKALGQPYKEDHAEALRVVVLGPGCYQCDQLEQRVLRALSELGLPASFEHITDIKEMAQYGFVTPPALLINGKIVAKGVVPEARKIKEWLEAAVSG